MRKIFALVVTRALRRLGAAMLFSATLAASVAGAHAASLAEPLVTPAWLNSHRADSNLVVLDIRSAIDGAPCPSKK